MICNGIKSHLLMHDDSNPLQRKICDGFSQPKAADNVTKHHVV